MTFRVRHIGLASSAKFGCITGAVSAIPVGIVLALVARLIIGWLHRLLEGWQSASIDAGPVKVPVDMVNLLHLTGTLSTLRTLDRLPLVAIAIVFVLFLLLAGFVVALIASWWAIAYNTMAVLTGGLTVELEPENITSRELMMRRRMGGR